VVSNLEGGKIKSFEKWIVLFKKVLDLPLSDELQSPCNTIEEEEERNKNIMWKLKGAASYITFRLFQKYGFKGDQSKDILPFVENFA
jgi:hypothetical protein